MLECQYAARHYYNKAELYSCISFILTMLSFLCICIPELFKNSALYLTLVLDSFALLVYFLMGKSVSSAAALRNYFDDTVLGFDGNHQPNEKRRLQEYILKAISKNEILCQQQITHDGRDTPPGVKNWYEFSKDYPDSEVVFECQKQNQWWNKKMTKLRLLIYSAVVVMSIIAVILVCTYFHVSFIQAIAYVTSMIITFSDRLYENCQYLRQSVKIDDFCEAYSCSRSSDQINALQDLIASRRELRVVEINYLHKRNSKKLSEQYAEISSKS